MSFITDAAAAAVTADNARFESERRTRLQKAFTDTAGKVLLDVTKLTTAHVDRAAGLLVLTDGTAYIAVGKDGPFRLVTRNAPGDFTRGAEFETLLELGLLLAAK